MRKLVLVSSLISAQRGDGGFNATSELGHFKVVREGVLSIEDSVSSCGKVGAASV